MGKNLGEFFMRKYFAQEKISIDMKYNETGIGEQLVDDSVSIEQYAINDGKWFILPRELLPQCMFFCVM